MAIPSHAQIMQKLGKPVPVEKQKVVAPTQIPKPEQIIAKADPTIDTKQPGLISRFVHGAAKFATRTAVEFANLATATLDFAGDTLSNVVSSKITERPITYSEPELALRKNLADRWKNFTAQTGEKTESLKIATQNLREMEFIQPSQEWESASTKEKFSKKHIGETLLTIGPGIVSSIGAFAINPALGFALSSGSVADDVKTIAIENGASEKKAESLGLGTGLVVGFLDKIVPDEVFSPTQKASFVQNFVKKLVTTSLKEAGTEIAQEDIQILAESTLRDDLGMDEIASRNAMAGLGGFIGGAGAAGSVKFANSIQSGDIGGAEDGQAAQQPQETATQAVPSHEDIVAVATGAAPVEEVRQKAVVTQKPDENMIVHSGKSLVEDVKKRGVIGAENGIFGKSVYFADQGSSSLQEFGDVEADKTYSIDKSKFDLVTLGTVAEQTKFIESQGLEPDMKNLTAALQKSGKDGAIITNPDPNIGSTYVISNLDKLNQVIRGEEVKPEVKRDKLGAPLDAKGVGIEINGKPIKVNDDGTITLYHRTNPKSAEKIKSEGFKGSRAENGNVFFSANEQADIGRPDGSTAVISIRISPEKIAQDLSGVAGDFKIKDTDLAGNYTNLSIIKDNYKSPSQKQTEMFEKSDVATDPLVEEAKKYKSAEEFVKAQRYTLYHQTNSADKILKEGFIKQQGMPDAGFSLTTDKNIAQQYRGGKGTTLEIKLKPDAKIIVLPDKYKNNIDDFLDIAKKQGYDAVDMRGATEKAFKGQSEVRLLNSKAVEVINKSQLTDIYNQARGADAKSTGLYGTNEEGIKLINSSDGKIDAERLYLLKQEAELYPNAKEFIKRFDDSDLSNVISNLDKLNQVIRGEEAKPKVVKEKQKDVKEVATGPLIEEAKKYKSAEEFVKAQSKNDNPVTVYHGGIEGESPNTLHENFFMTKSRTEAESYAKRKYGDAGMVTEIKINPQDLTGPNNALTAVKGVKLYRDENGIYRIKTKSQLTDIYNQAQEGKTEEKQAEKKQDVQVKSREKDLKPISEEQVKTAKNVKEVKAALNKIKTELDAAVVEAKGMAEVAKTQREGLNTEKINRLKRIYANTKKFQEGDIETIRASRHKELLNLVVENVQEVNPGMSEEEAFSFALDLPTKAQETARTEKTVELSKKAKTLSKYLDLLKVRQQELAIQQDDVLVKEWEDVLAVQEDLYKIIKVPSTQIPVGEGKKKVSRLEARARGLQDATDEQIERLGLATYNQVNNKENVAKAREYVSANPNEAIRVVKGEIEPPKGILKNSVYIALKESGSKDADLATRIASLDATRLGQEISVLQEIDKDNPVTMMEDITRTRLVAWEKKTKQKAGERIKKEGAAIEQETPKVTKDAWADFLESIEC